MAAAPSRLLLLALHLLSHLGTSSGSTSTSPAARVLWSERLTRANDGKVHQFKDVSVSIGAGSRVGLVGANGSGKSTLLKALAGVERADDGVVESARGTRILYVEQEPPLRGRTVREHVYTGIAPDASSTVDASLRAAFEYHEASTRSETDADALARAASAAEGCWEDDARLGAVCELLGLTPILDKDVGTCSGGERKRAGLAAALAREPDVLLLDEPTNHLDARAVDYLIELLTKPAPNRAQPAVVCVSHDRFFLEAVCADGLLELEGGALHAYEWRGEYGRYLELKEERLAAQANVAERARTLLRRERDWMSRQPQARETKSRARIDRYFDLEATAAGAAGGRRAAELSRLGEGMARLGTKVLELSGAALAHPARRADGAPLLSDVDLVLEPRARWGVVGANGCGKSTLLRAIVGTEPLAAGARAVGETVRFGYYDQRGLEAEMLDASPTGGDGAAPPARAAGGGGGSGAAASAPAGVPAADPLSMRVLEFVQRAVDEARTDGSGHGGVSETPLGAGGAEAAARRLLDLLGFPRAQWGALVGRLSGGERRRLQLLRVLARAPNVLVLDEPTNDIDLPTISALEQFLHEEFDGVLLCVSHDRAFVERTCTDGVLALLGDGSVRQMGGGYAEYVAAVRARDEAARLADATAAPAPGGGGDGSAAPASAPPGAAKRAGRVRTSKKKLSFNEAREYESIEADVERLRAELEAAEAAVEAACTADGAYDQVSELSARAAELALEVEAREERWLELMERAAEVELQSQ